MKRVLRKLQDFFYTGPVKAVPEGHNHCPGCDGTGDYDAFIDCLYCDGKGYVKHSELVNILIQLKNDKV